jgi:hypothetical protein
MLPGVQKSVRVHSLTLPNELPFWELESEWTFEFLEGNCRGQIHWIEEFFIPLEALGT